jgi:hypothetical protein
VKRTSFCLGLLSLVSILAAVGCEDDNFGNTLPEDGGPSPQLPDSGAPVIDCPAPTAGPTMHKNDVQDGEVWTAAGSPHVVDYDVTVRNGAKLTIEPCAVVELKKGQHIKVAYPGTPGSGTLIAEGTAERPIRFKAKDAEPWASIYVHAPGTARFAHVTFEGGGGGDFEDNATIDALGNGELPADPILFLDHVTIKKSVGTGIWMQRGATFMPGSRDVTITESGNEATPFPLQIEEHAIDALPTGNYKGNKIDEILLRTAGDGIAGGGLTVDATLHERGVPYRMGKSKLDNFIIGRSDDAPVATLTIEPGVIMRFEKETAFKVQTFTTDKPSTAAVRASGTADKPIVFTSASPTPKAGDWRGLWFGGIPQATNKLEHVRIEYAGFDCSCSLNTCSNVGEHDGAVIFTNQIPSAFITNTVFKEIAGHGITEGYDGDFVNFRPTNTFEGVQGCVQTRPRTIGGSCPTPRPACDGM